MGKNRETGGKTLKLERNWKILKETGTTRRNGKNYQKVPRTIKKYQGVPKKRKIITKKYQ